MVQVLLVEDEEPIRRVLSRGLADLGHAVTTAATGAEAIAEFTAHRPDVVVLDLGLPDIDGQNVLAMSRVIDVVPVIVATARDDEDDIIRLLNAGADDYLVKPFSAAQMDARIRAVLRRAPSSAHGDGDIELVVGDLRLDPTRHTVRFADRGIELSRKEFELLQVLMRNVGKVVTKADLLTQVWQLPWGSADRTVDVHLSWLRRKLGESAAEPRYLTSVRGVGIKMVDPTAKR